MNMRKVLAILLSACSLFFSAQAGPKRPACWHPIVNAIYFYDRAHDYYEFTNFYRARIVMPDSAGRPVSWPTTEHYFQAMKFVHMPRLMERIRACTHAREAFKYAQAHYAQIRADWPQVKYEIMHRAVLAKFKQHPSLARLLVSTRKSTLVEDAGGNDAHWGAGPDYTGSNHLGRILMHVRRELTTGRVHPYKP